MTAGVNEKYLEILKSELVPAMGCTEPISVAYAAALARKVLGVLPTYVRLTVSANIIKNVKSVVVPVDKLSIIVTVIFSYFVFKEKLSKKAFAGICLMVVGTLLMVFFK